MMENCDTVEFANNVTLWDWRKSIAVGEMLL